MTDLAAPRTWSTTEVLALVGRHPATHAPRVFPHRVDWPGSGSYHRWSEADVAGALILAALEPASPGRNSSPAWVRQLAADLAEAAPSWPAEKPWALWWPISDRRASWMAVAAEQLPGLVSPDGPIALGLLLLDNVLAPLRP